MEDLAYRRLLDEYYLQESPLLGEPDDIARQIGMIDQVAAVGYVLGAYFDGGPGGWINKRCDQEIETYRARIEQRSRAGKASVQRRLNARSTDDQFQHSINDRSTTVEETGNDRSTDVEEISTSVQLTNNHKPITNISSLRSDSATDLNSDLKSEKAKRARQIPIDFQPTDQHRQLAQDLGLNLDREFAKFSDHHRARGTVFKDWDAALRTWLRKSLDFGTRPGPAQTPIDPAVVERSKANHKVFVELDSPDWLAWKAVKPTWPVCDHKAEDGKIKRGWWFPSSRP